MNFKDRLRYIWYRYTATVLGLALALSASPLRADDTTPQASETDIESEIESTSDVYRDGEELLRSNPLRREDNSDNDESLDVLNRALSLNNEISRLSISSNGNGFQSVVDEDGNTHELERIPVGMDLFNVKLLRQARQAKATFRENRVVKVLVAVDERDTLGHRYAEEQIAEVRQTLAALKKEDGIDRKLVIVRAPQTELEEFAADWNEILSQLKEQKSDPASVEKLETTIKRSRFGEYWARVYAPPLKDEITRGLLAGALLQGFITFMTEYFLLSDQKVPAEIIADTALIAFYGGGFGIFNTTWRNIRNIPANWGSAFMRTWSSLGLTPSFAKALANSGVFATIMTVNKTVFQHIYGHGKGLAAFTFADYVLVGTLFNLASHCVLSQFARVNFEAIVNLREKYGWISSRASFLQTQVAIFGTYLVFRLGHMYYREFWQKAADASLVAGDQVSLYSDIVGNYVAPVLPYGLAAMTAAGFIVHAGYRMYLTKVLKTGKRYIAAIDEDRGEMVLTEVPVDYANLKEFKTSNKKFTTKLVDGGKNMLKASYNVCAMAFGGSPAF